MQRLMGLQRRLGVQRQGTDLSQKMKQIRQVAYGDLVEGTAELNHYNKVIAVIDGGRWSRSRSGFGQELSDLWGVALLSAPDYGDAEGFALAVSEICVGIKA